MTNVPTGYYFTKTHEWAKEEGGYLLIGISDYAQHHLGDIVFVDVKPVGSEVKAGEAFGAIESVKAAEDLYAPVSGKIHEINAELQAHPEKVNHDPFGTWMARVAGYNKEDLKKLMDSSAYEAYLATVEG